MAGIFINYRREDAAADAGRLFDDLRRRYKDEHVFMDLTIEAGKDFRAALSEKLETCDVLLALMGPRWLHATNEATGKRRLDEEQDFVRLEIATALAQQKLVIPVILPGAQMPSPGSLPESIRELAWRNAFELHYKHWVSGVNELVQQFPDTLVKNWDQLREICEDITERQMETVRGKHHETGPYLQRKHVREQFATFLDNSAKRGFVLLGKSGVGKSSFLLKFIEEVRKGYDLSLMSVDTADGLLDDGRNLVIVALVGPDLHIRIFDANGKRVVDKAENQLISGETLTALKKELNPLPDESALSQKQKQKFIRDATSIAGHTPACVLMYDAENILLSSTSDITTFISKHFTNRVHRSGQKVQDVWREINKMDTTQKQQFIFCVDAINRNQQPTELLRQLNELVGEWVWLKIVFSCRREIWPSISIRNGVTLPERFYAEVEMLQFSPKELQEVYDEYQRAYKLKTPYASLSKRMQETLRDPFNLWLLKAYAVPDLSLMSVDAAHGLLNDGRNLVIVALVGTDLHIRIFDANGKRVVDKAENKLIGGETLTALKKQLHPLPDESGLSQEQKQKFIRDATSIAGHTPYDSQAMPETVKASELIEHYVDTLLPREDLWFLEDKLVPLMLRIGHYSDVIRGSGLYRTDEAVFDKVFRDQLSDGRPMNESFLRLADAEILVRRDLGGEGTIKFAHERFYEHFAGKEIAKIASLSETQADRYTFFLELIEEIAGKKAATDGTRTTSKPFLWGAVRNALVKEGETPNSETILKLCRTTEGRVKEMMVDVLVTRGRDFGEEVEGILKRLLPEEKEASELQKLRRVMSKGPKESEIVLRNTGTIAMEVASKLGIVWVLQQAALREDPSLRTEAVRYSYYLWQRDRAGYDLRLMSVAAADGLVNEGCNLVIVALVGSDLHIRIFDTSGEKVVDKAENELVSGETLTALKKQLNPIPDESDLSKEHKQKIIGDATSIAGHTHRAFAVLEYVAEKATAGLIPNFRAFEFVFALSVIIFFEHHEDEAALDSLQRIWRRMIAKLFRVHEGGSPWKARVRDFTRERIIGFIVSLVFGLFEALPSYTMVSYKALKAFFQLGATEKALYRRLVYYFDVKGDYTRSQMEHDYLEAIQIDNVLIMLTTLIGLAAQACAAPLAIFPFLKELFEAAKSKVATYPYLTIISNVAMEVLYRDPKNDEMFDFFVYTAGICQEYYAKYPKAARNRHLLEAPLTAAMAPYIIFQYRREGTVKTRWLEERIQRALKENNLPFFDHLLKMELPQVGIEHRRPRAALETMELFFQQSFKGSLKENNRKLLQEYSIAFLSRLRIHEADEVDAFLDKQQALLDDQKGLPDEQQALRDLRLQVSTNQRVESIGDLLGKRGWYFLRDRILLGSSDSSKALRSQFMGLLEKAADSKNAKAWMDYNIRLLINLIYGEQILRQPK